MDMLYGTPVYVGRHKDKSIDVFMAYRYRYYNNDDGITVVFHSSPGHKNTWDDYSFYITEEQLPNLESFVSERVHSCKKEYYRRFCYE